MIPHQLCPGAPTPQPGIGDSSSQSILYLPFQPCLTLLCVNTFSLFPEHTQTILQMAGAPFGMCLPPLCLEHSFIFILFLSPCNFFQIYPAHIDLALNCCDVEYFCCTWYLCAALYFYSFRDLSSLCSRARPWDHRPGFSVSDLCGYKTCLI